MRDGDDRCSIQSLGLKKANHFIRVWVAFFGRKHKKDSLLRSFFFQSH